MDYSEKIEALQDRVSATKMATQTAINESHEQLKLRAAQLEDSSAPAAETTETETETEETGSRSGWDQMKADVSEKRQHTKSKIDKRNRHMDAKAAKKDAEWAESEALAAIDFATGAVVNAEVAILDAIDARLLADELAASDV